ncbi:hypothetical protein TNCV_3554781 [Trichonephila clavipes]|nr:hypothetical protein TNCV_3554781 [Trichonephila clavipes]
MSKGPSAREGAFSKSWVKSRNVHPRAKQNEPIHFQQILGMCRWKQKKQSVKMEGNTRERDATSSPQTPGVPQQSTAAAIGENSSRPSSQPCHRMN